MNLLTLYLSGVALFGVAMHMSAKVKKNHSIGLMAVCCLLWPLIVAALLSEMMDKSEK